jgi:hypothetical protein
MEYTFCTYFDRNYYARGLALYQSLKAHCSSFRLWVLCLDDSCYQELASMQLPEVRLISVEQLERAFPELHEARHNRSLIEFYFTCTPALPLYILERWPDVPSITYLDADMFFFADPAPVFDEIGDRSIAIVEHRYPAYLHDMEVYGRYNVGWLSFRRDAQGLACLQLWLRQCIEWCYDRLDGERYADQKYLEQWPQLFSNLVVLQHKGVNVAPWNIMNETVRLKQGLVYVGDQPLIVFHFHGFKRKLAWLYDTHTARYLAGTSRVMRARIYGPYIQALQQAPMSAPASQGVRYQATRRSWVQKLLLSHRLLHYAKGLFDGQYLIYINGRVLPMLMLAVWSHESACMHAMHGL